MASIFFVQKLSGIVSVRFRGALGIFSIVRFELSARYGSTSPQTTFTPSRYGRGLGEAHSRQVGTENHVSRRDNNNPTAARQFCPKCCSTCDPNVMCKILWASEYVGGLHQRLPITMLFYMPTHRSTELFLYTTCRPKRIFHSNFLPTNAYRPTLLF